MPRIKKTYHDAELVIKPYRDPELVIGRKRSSAGKRSAKRSAETKEEICGSVTLSDARRALQSMDKESLCAIVSKAGWQQIREHVSEEEAPEKPQSANKRKKPSSGKKKRTSAPKKKATDQSC